MRQDHACYKHRNGAFSTSLCYAVGLLCLSTLACGAANFQLVRQLCIHRRWIIFAESYDVVLQPQSWLKLLFCLAACISAALHMSDSFSMHATDLRAILNLLQVRKA